MIRWRDLLEPIPAPITSNCTIKEAVQRIKKAPSRTLFVYDQTELLGYVNDTSLLEQLVLSPSLEQPIAYCTDILIVEEQTPLGFYHNVSLVLCKGKNGKFIGFSTLENMRKQVNYIKLKQTVQIFNSAGIGVITTNDKFQITFMNEKAEEIFGVSHDVLLYRNYNTLLSISKSLGDILNGKQYVNMPGSFNNKHFIGNFSPLYEQGRIIGVVHLFYLREQLEEAVQELEFVRNLNEDLQAIYTSSNEQIVVVDAGGKIIRLSGNFSPDFWLKNQPEDVIGESVYQLEKEGVFPAAIIEECQKQQQKIMHVQETRRGRKLWAVAVPVLKENKIEKVIIVLRDITELDKYQQEKGTVEDNPENEENLYQRLVYRSKIIEDIVHQIKYIAKVDSTVLLHGESGVGKEVFAQTLHSSSFRKDNPFIRVNCGAIPENLMESEFFGYEGGAFTGADKKGRPGLFELAHEGTIFLDEIAELPLNLQVKLLRVLQEKEVRRVGGIHNIPINIRIIAATNKDLRKMVRENTFREDLYYRLNVIPIEIPPLRERTVDVLSLSLHFLKLFNEMYKQEKQLSRETIEILETYHWPGNIRELRNVIERLVVTTRKNFIEGTDVLSILYSEARKGAERGPMICEIIPLKEAIDQVESELISLALQKYHTAAEAATALKISESTISRKIQKRFRR